MFGPTVWELKGGLDGLQPHSEETLRQWVKFLFRTLDMKRPLNVLHRLTGFEGGGGRRGLQLIEWPQRSGSWFGRTIVVRIDHIPGVRLILPLLWIHKVDFSLIRASRAYVTEFSSDFFGMLFETGDDFRISICNIRFLTQVNVQVE